MRLLGMLVPAVLAGTLGAQDGPSEGKFVLAGVHPEAAAQRTAQGKTLVTLYPFRGRLYAGYGDYTANTGPIHINPYDPARGTFVGSQWKSDTEAILHFREIGGELWAPCIDPKVKADFALLRTDGKWADREVVPSTHVFDAGRIGNSVFLAGSHGNSAVVWKSADRGTTFKESLSRLPVSGTPKDFARFYFAGVFKGKLYLQAADYFGGPHPAGLVFDGKAWADGPNLLPVKGVGWHAVEFAGRMVYLTFGAGHAVSQLLAFDGTQAVVAADWSAYDIAIAGDSLFALDADGTVRRTKDLTTWAEVATAPVGGRCLAVTGGKLYVGASEGKLYRFTGAVK